MQKQINIQGKQIFYRIIGSGTPVVLIHGFGEDSSVWKPPQTPPREGLRNTPGQINEDSFLFNNNPDKRNLFKFIIPDLPGSCQSAIIDDMSVEGMAEVIKQILDIESSKVPPSGGFRGALIGHSMGGYITLAFAEKYPEYLSAFGLFHSTAYADNEEKKSVRRKGIEFINEFGAFEFLKKATSNLFSPNSKKHFPDLIEGFISSLHNFSPQALVSYYEAMIQRPDRTAVLKNATVPVLFILGEHDNAVPLQDVLKQCHLPEKSYIHILHQSGHMGMLEEPDTSNRILENFLNEIIPEDLIVP